MFNHSIVFEQPVNELIRVCLRLEHLLQFVHQGLRGASMYENHAAVAALTDILTLTDRPDLRGKFIKEFLRQTANLQRFINEAHIDQTKLTTTLAEFDDIIKLLQKSTGKFASNLRENDFLNIIRQHLTIPGGSCSFDTPAFFYWLQQPVKERQTTLIHWLKEMEDLFRVIQFMLRLVRQSGQTQMHTAHGGFYQTSLDPNMPCQLIRVAIAKDIHPKVFVEISVGRHGVSLRFFHQTIGPRAVPCEEDVPFRIIYCIL